MKRIILGILLLCSISGFAQILKSDSSMSFVSVEGSCLKSKVYLKTTLKNQKEDGYLIFEAFRNGVWQYIGNVEVIGVPIDLPLLYCFSFDDPGFISGEFRVTCLTPGKSKITSDPFSVKKFNYPSQSTAENEVQVTNELELFEIE